ncbi:MAG: efflux RND transporter permease subunit, partial [Paracoccaceae bacterium]
MRRAVQGTTQGILSYFTRHRTMANLLLILLLAAGMYALPKMRAQFFPDSVIETIRVQVAWPGAGAEDVDRAIVQLLEPALLGIEGVESSDAVSREGVANIRLDFEPGWDMAKADDDVSNVVDGLTGLPADAETPHTTVFSFSERVTDVVITGPVGVDQLAGYADELVGRLFAEGVTRTSIRGVAAPETVVEVSTANLIAYDVTLREIADVIAAQVDANPAGDVAGAGARVRTGVEKRSVQQIEAITLRSYSDGRKLTIGDVATITVNGADRDRSYFVGTNPAVSIRVDRTAQGDAIDIQRRVQEVAETVEATLPAGTTIDLIRTRAEVITGRLRILIENGIMGLGLVLVLLFLFLNARTAFWVAADIPIAMMA